MARSEVSLAILKPALVAYHIRSIGATAASSGYNYKSSQLRSPYRDCCWCPIPRQLRPTTGHLHP